MLCAGQVGARIEREKVRPPAATNAPAPAGLTRLLLAPPWRGRPLLRRCGRVGRNKSSAASEAPEKGEPTPAAEMGFRCAHCREARDRSREVR